MASEIKKAVCMWCHSHCKVDVHIKDGKLEQVTGVSGETGIDLEAFFKKGATSDPERNALKPEGYIEKPVDPQKLLKLVKRALR